MISLHPFVYYYKDEGQISHGNFVLTSDCTTHDTVAIHLFQHHLISHLVRWLYGPIQELKNFLNLCLHEEDFNILAEWHFFAAHHGKGPSDVIRGTIKHDATKASLQLPYKDQNIDSS